MAAFAIEHRLFFMGKFTEWRRWSRYATEKSRDQALSTLQKKRRQYLVSEFRKEVKS